jgi:hypothetical protein
MDSAVSWQSLVPNNKYYYERIYTEDDIFTIYDDKIGTFEKYDIVSEYDEYTGETVVNTYLLFTNVRFANPKAKDAVKDIHIGDMRIRQMKCNRWRFYQI